MRNLGSGVYAQEKYNKNIDETNGPVFEIHRGPIIEFQTRIVEDGFPIPNTPLQSNTI